MVTHKTIQTNIVIKITNQTMESKIEINNSTLHHLIITSIIKHGRAPTISEMALNYKATTQKIRDALQKLQDYHGVVLHPNSDEIWVCHPFSLAPTNFRITNEDKTWYGTCGWCSFGTAKLLGGNVKIKTMLADTGEVVELNIENNELVNANKEFCVFFPIKMTEAWSNVTYTCQCMQLFSCAKGIQEWSKRHFPPGRELEGSIQPIHKCFEFAKEWYAHHDDPNWIKWTAKDAMEMFKRHGLVGEIWKLPSSQNQF